MQDLKETIELMQSEDYKERFKAEYWQLKIRYEKLKDIIFKFDTNQLNFQLTTSIDILRKQKNAMEDYLYYLEVRTNIENITL